MVNTFTAGQRLRAEDMVERKIWTVSSTSSSAAITTAETIVLTSPSTTYRAGRAYRLRIRTRIAVTASAAAAIVAIRDTNISGFIRMSDVYKQCPSITVGWGFYHEHVIANATASDVTGKVMVMTLRSSANTVTFNASSVHPTYWTCSEIGSSDDYPEAVLF